MAQVLVQDVAIQILSRTPPSQVRNLLEEFLVEEKRCAKVLADCSVDAGHAYRDFHSWGYDDVLSELIRYLETLAGACEKRLSRERTLLDLIRRELQTDEEAHPHYYPPAASFGEPIVLAFDQSPPLLKIEMEGMLPYSLDTGACYLHEKLRIQLGRFSEEWHREHGEAIALFPAAVVFIHHHDRTKKLLNYVRDYDNLERKCIINTLQAARIMSDNPKRMVDMNLAMSDERTYTEILVTKVEHLPWLLKRLDFSLYM